ncbi:MAG: PIN domain-containing protein [Jatrophihabitantaceae bacterium]
MSHHDRVFVDANELFPFSIMDLLLSLAEDLLLDFCWTDELLDEWQRVIVREGRRSPQTAASVATAVREHFASTRIDPAVYRNHLSHVPGRDPDDRVHTAACAYGPVTVLLTRNQRDFPADFLAQHGVTVCSADEYLHGLLQRRPSAFLDVVRRAAGQKQQPPRTPCELALGLAQAGAPHIATSLRHRLHCPESR